MPKVKTVPAGSLNLSDFPNFSSTGSIRGMKKQFYGQDALLIRMDAYIYNVSSQPDIYYNLNNGPIPPEEQLLKKGAQPYKWQGIKDDGTNKVNAGYLYISFKNDCSVLNTEHAGQKESIYKTGQQIGFKVRDVANRKQAIDKFNRVYVITPLENKQC